MAQPFAQKLQKILEIQDNFNREKECIFEILQIANILLNKTLNEEDRTYIFHAKAIYERKMELLQTKTIEELRKIQQNN